MTLPKKLAIALAAVLLLAVLAAGGVWLWARSSVPEYAGDATLAGLGAPVEVLRDEYAIPHVRAESEADLYRAMGWLHAQDRLWQMELFRRVADGRLAEVLGEPALASDRFLRTVGIGRATAADEALLTGEERALIEAYADGVNAWIEHHEGALPPEFLLLRFEPEPWTVRNSLSVGRVMAWDVAEWSTGLEHQRARDLVGDSLAALLRWEYEGPDILGDDAAWGDSSEDVDGAGGIVGSDATADDDGIGGAMDGASGDDGDVSTSARTRPAMPDLAGPAPRFEVPALALRLVESLSASRASNAWVIGGARTRSGKPIVASDMHLALRAPSIWYLASLEAPGYRAAGMTIPGVPLVVVGHTPSVAWGFTNAMVDDVDLFVEEVDPDDPTRYRTPDGWRAFEERPESIQVKGMEPVVHVVRTTRNGPVLSDVERRSGDRVLSMRWAAYEPAATMRALRGAGRARTAAELRTALRDFRMPHQNVVYADTAGAIGYQMTGRVPVRASGDGLLPAPGWTDDHAWRRYLDFDEHPHAENPSEGFVVTANNRQSGRFPHLVAGEWMPPLRAARIRQMVEPARDLTADDVAAQQMDVVDLLAVRMVPHAVRAAETAGEADAAELLRGWDGAMEMDSEAASLFWVWFEGLKRRVAEDEYDGERIYFPRTALMEMLDAGDGPWADDVRTPERETLDALAAEQMRAAVETVAGRSWGEVHPTTIEHALGGVAALNRVARLNVGPFPNRGGPYTVNVAGWGGTRPPFANSYGPSQRHVVDMADPDGSGGFVLPTGQSGIPFSDHYDDQTPLWREGRLIPVPLGREAAETRAAHRTTLRPE